MKLSRIGRVSMALAASVALGLGMTACGGGTIGFMWVTGTTSTSTTASSIVGYKIDDFTGNLTNIPKSPFNSVGVNPGVPVVRTGGRYVYVVNKGTFGPPTPTQPDGVPNRDGNISEFLVGGDGTLTFQENYVTAGGTPVWAAIDSSGSYLYALDSLAPAGSGYDTNFQGDVTVFSIAGDTGRLSIVTNQQIKDANNINIRFFPVGQNPTMMRVAASSCLFILDKNSASDPYRSYVFPYQVAAGGQLTTVVSGNVPTGPTDMSSITNGGGAYLYLTDVGVAKNPDGTPSTAGNIYAYSVGTNCALNAVVNSPFANVPSARNPVWTITEARNSKFVYVLNQSNNNATQPNSSISAFSIDSTGKLTQLGGANNPFAVGSGPTCMIEDPTNKYLYTSNSVDGTVTGLRLNLSDGSLGPLQHGSSFTAVTHANCLAVSGATS